MHRIFLERGKVATSPRSTLVVSDMVEGGKVVGVSLNRIVNHELSTAVTSGIFIPLDLVPEVVDLLLKETNGKEPKCKP